MKYVFALLPLLLLTACLDDEMAYTVEASPVRAIIVKVADAPQGTVAFTGTFTQLDKDGILDYNVGIVATPVADLELDIYSQNQDLLTTIITGTDGTVTLSLPADNLNGVTRLEWAGTYEGKAFRILSNL